MKLQLCQLTFDHAHFGEGTLDSSSSIFSASRLYSALYLEAMKLNQSQEFLNFSRSETFVLSDAFPYIEGTPFLPKPIGYPEYVSAKSYDLKSIRRKSKLTKKVDFIPLTELENFLKRKVDLYRLAELANDFAEYDYVMKKGLDPFEVGVTTFANSLYIITSANTLLNQLLESLQYSGLGGKRSSGYGRFSMKISNVPLELEKRLVSKEPGYKLLMTTSYPQKKELRQTIDGAKYLLKKESGFAYSLTTGVPLRKRDLYKFKAGSVFQNEYRGDIYDVSPEDFSHPVWNFSKGLFFNLNGMV